MRIGLDARKLRDFGIGTYIENLLTYIPEFDSDNEYIIFHYPEDEDFIPRTGSNITLVADASPKYSIHELVTLPVKMWQQRLDVFHAPHYTLPPLRHCRGVVTIHDVIHLRFPEYLPHPMAYYYAKGIMWAATKSAKKVITVSECSKQDIMRYLGIPEDKIAVVYNGIDADVRISDMSENSNNLEKRFGISRKYILYLGNFMPHKNLDTLVKAFSILKHRYHLAHCLVLAGKNEKIRQKLQTLITKERLEDDVVLTGFVEPAWLSRLYAGADLFVYPSLYEGFGLQALEAMAYHIPVAISNVAALPEIAGEAALRFDPTSAENMAETIYTGLNDQFLRKSLIEKGQERLKSFSWQEMTRKTIAIYQGVMRNT